MNNAHRIACLSALLLVACGSTPERTEPTTREPASSPVFDVHEWGVLSLRIDDEIAFGELGAGPGSPEGRAHARIRRPELTIDKPVLYVHSDESSLFDVEFEVRLIPHLSFAETFPPVASNAGDQGETVAWRTSVRPGHCSSPAPAFPASGDALCQGTPDGYCEGAELPRYVTSDASCLGVGDSTTPLLFYRGTSSGRALGAFPSPVNVRRQPENMMPVLHVTRTSDAEPTGKLWLIERDPSGTRVSSSSWPERGAEVESFEASSVDAASGALRQDLVAQGLTSTEVEVFMQTWSAPLFGPPAGSSDEPALPSDGESIDELSVDGLLPPPVESDGVTRELIFWWPQSSLHALAALRMHPAPRNVHRAMLVRVSISD